MPVLNQYWFQCWLGTDVQYRTSTDGQLPAKLPFGVDLKKMLEKKRFGSNEEVITETEAYFESKGESFYKKGIEMLEKRWNECITLEGNYVDE